MGKIKHYGFHDIDDEVRLTGTFRDADGSLTTPTTTTLRVKDPSGNVSVVNNASLTSGGTGIKYYDLLVDEAGDWYFRFNGTGNIEVSEEGYFTVVPRQVPNS